MDVHVAMLNGCMGSRVKQDLLLARTCAFHTKQPLCKCNSRTTSEKLVLGPKTADVSFLSSYSISVKAGHWKWHAQKANLPPLLLSALVVRELPCH